MAETNDATKTNTNTNGTARRLGLVALLVAGTLAGGVLLRGQAAPAPGGNDADLARHFRAPLQGPVSFRGELDRTAVMPPGDGLVRMELVLAAEERAAAAGRVPTDLVVVLDRSGSMAGDKLEHARAAIRALVEQLGPDDRFGLVTYAQHSERVIGLEPPRDGARQRWLAAVDRIPARGGTNLASGLDAGIGLLQGAHEKKRSIRFVARAQRLVLISDGLANQGDTSRSGLLARARRASQREAVLSSVGVGVDFDGELMAGLADAGTGNFHFLESAVGLAEVFAAEFETARETLARALEVGIRPAPGVEVVDAAGYPLERTHSDVRFRPGTLFSGQERRLWVTLRVAEGAPAIVELAKFRLRYRADGESHTAHFDQTPQVARVANPDDYYAGMDAEAWARSVVVDEVSALQREVANDVAAGRAPAALEKAKRLRKDLARQNHEMKSSVVADSLADLDAIEEKLEQHTAGEAEMRPEELQQLRSLGYVNGRPGGRK